MATILAEMPLSQEVIWALSVTSLDALGPLSSGASSSFGYVCRASPLLFSDPQQFCLAKFMTRFIRHHTASTQIRVGFCERPSIYASLEMSGDPQISDTQAHTTNLKAVPARNNVQAARSRYARLEIVGRLFLTNSTLVSRIKFKAVYVKGPVKI